MADKEKEKLKRAKLFEYVNNLAVDISLFFFI